MTDPLGGDTLRLHTNREELDVVRDLEIRKVRMIEPYDTFVAGERGVEKIEHVHEFVLVGFKLFPSGKEFVRMIPMHNVSYIEKQFVETPEQG